MTTAIPSIYEVLGEARVTVVPGLLHWLGLPERPASEPEETWEAFCARISKGAAS